VTTMLDQDGPVARLFTRDPTDPSVLVADGYGRALSVDRGHLLIRDGIGRHRRERRLPRAQRRVRRIVLLGHTGHVTLDAIRWCADTGITLTQIDSEGGLLLHAGAPSKNDARLRRAQAAAANAPVGLDITRALLGAKLDGQAAVAEQLLHNDRVADVLTGFAVELADAASLPVCRDLEAQASNAYFGAWAGTVTCRFAERDQGKVPDHWRWFAVRRSPLNRGNTPRGATDPVNALLNYSYTLAEAECRLAALAVGLDPGLGIVHTDKKARDSLALDLLEALRPVAERHVLELLQQRYFHASDFHETRHGVCRLLPPLTHDLAQATPTYAAAVAPLAEQLAHALAMTSPGKISLTTPLTRANITNAQIRGKRRGNRRAAGTRAPRRTCRTCGADLYGSARQLCPTCWPVARNEHMRQLGKARASPRDPKPAVERVSGGITLGQYQTMILPSLAIVSLPQIEKATGLCNASCSRIRRGLQIPNPRHWAALAALTTSPAPNG
jgi:CRISPR-associated endonuclease Cas1